MPKRVDDRENIPDGTFLFRILRLDFIRTDEDGVTRMQGNAFLDGQFETSCFIDSPGLWEMLQHLFPGSYVAKVSAGHVRAAGYMVGFATTAEDCSLEPLREQHVVLFPPAGVTNNENKRRCDAIRKGAELLGPLRLAGENA